eukprot:NODE_440_length_1563_cov_297.509947.p1 GENE.NODE_440_length_1563_cov_297.509947~~NODE_440_length_1563_cov_297.509947.p1  ORF type:complete len:401 (+),score=101.21 NODE_440_length_1563_cov_297.509947:3-1205(+)
MGAGSILKILTFLVGLLISLLLKESLDRYKKCLSAMIEFQEEYIALWYHVQMTLARKPPAQRIIASIHMACFGLSLMRYLMNKAELEIVPIKQMVQPEFQHCAIFDESGAYASIVSNPAYSELILVSWLKTCGILNGELRKRVEEMRTKLRVLLTTQCVKSPNTSAVLLRMTTHIFLLLVPVCVSHMPTRVFMPVIAVVLLTLLTLAEELEDPFGTDRHDLPWMVLLANITCCTFSKKTRPHIDEAIDFLNKLCLHSRWDEDQARSVLGDRIVFDRFTGNKYDTGTVHIRLYLTLPKLCGLDVVGRPGEKVPDIIIDWPTNDAKLMPGMPSGAEANRRQAPVAVRTRDRPQAKAASRHASLPSSLRRGSDPIASIGAGTAAAPPMALARSAAKAASPAGR